MFVSHYIALISCGIKLEVNYLHKAVKLISAYKVRFVIVLYSFELCYCIKKIAVNNSNPQDINDCMMSRTYRT
jgi:hypothetical protein